MILDAYIRRDACPNLIKVWHFRLIPPSCHSPCYRLLLVDVGASVVVGSVVVIDLDGEETSA